MGDRYKTGGQGSGNRAQLSAVRGENASPPQGALLSKPCKAKRSDGEPCRAPANGAGYCFWHDPSLRASMLTASAKGGSRKQLALPAAVALTPRKARALLAAILPPLLAGALDPTTARSVGYLLQCDAKLAALSDLEGRIKALEERLNGK